MTIKTKRFASNIKHINAQYKKINTETNNINLYECLSPNYRLIITSEEFKNYIIGAKFLDKFTKKRLMIELESAMNIYATLYTKYISNDIQFISSQHINDYMK